MRFLWHPLADLFLADPLAPATPAALRFVLARAGTEVLRYSGDRMWPAIRHHQALTARRANPGSVRRGAVVVASCDGRPDILRVDSVRDTALVLTADADPDLSLQVTADQILAVVESREGTVPAWRRWWNRLRLDLEEALRGRPDAVESQDAAATVREKYDAQAQGYRDSPGDDLEPELLERIRARIPGKRSLLVVGCGTGRESLALAREGWTVVGIDFAPRMIEIAQQAAVRSALPATFLLADIRSFEWAGPPFAAAVFTYDAYSFIPGAATRVAVLKRIARCLEADGAVYLSARLLGSGYRGFVLSTAWLARPFSAWGDSHTRWLAADGSIRRSFVHLFTRRRLRAEARAAGFGIRAWAGGHGLLTRR